MRGRTRTPQGGVSKGLPLQLSGFVSPLGRISVAERAGRVLAVGFASVEHLLQEHPELGAFRLERSGTGPEAGALKSYLSGETERLSTAVDLTLVRSEFAREVLKRLMRVGRGKTVTYAELGAFVDRPGAARAVGSAMRKNPIPILVPCHRVLPKAGGLGNYTGGVDKKEWLLRREGVLSRTP